MTTTDWLMLAAVAFGTWFALGICAVALWVWLRRSGWRGIQ